MDNRDKKNKENMFQEGDFLFPFGKFENMAEMMRSGCTGEGGMADCCSRMRKMMEAEKANHPFNCAEMMSQMMKMCCTFTEKKEESSQKTTENPAPNL
jgi:hypothetical protein